MTREDVNVTEKVVKARQKHRCDVYNASSFPVIKPGDLYIVATEFLGGESGYASSVGHPVSMRICEGCANLRQRELISAARTSRHQVERQDLTNK